MQLKTNTPQSVNALEKAYAQLQKVIKYIVAVLLACMVLIVFSNVVSRYFLKAALAWSEEVSRFMFIWLVFLSAVLTYVNDEHLNLDILVKSLPKKVGLLLSVISDILVSYALVLLTVGGQGLAQSSWAWLSPATSFSYGVVYLIVPICAGLMLLQTIFKLIVHVKKLLS